ncbi:branched-chain amino acid transport system substrate-binding protein [Microbacteriaceae bacterium SG_E_30_P1]|uniref:Branched-chain amino acid transport system substrate-binding protein n=1 Tax=Antiquaquibacter oligotrophicus TaxID=2880260 RepID=A0ABT6KTE2_9MICO|nr:ABC transporter substrate-binding protein [Antiquaquibacter oligotrophicus]MDH6182462.1 branched-chain amino acid transport system substrate-binding protein [Antiquaquibacter oligotrophicus]UDF14567.1 ABC transporter substrate-binding protein [Antiquaquibacter oligotrophicus]
MNHRTKIAIPAIGVIAVMALSACAASDAPSEESDPIVIGVASAQTGFFSGFDGPVKNAIELAVADQNAAGGVLGRQLEVVVSDTKSDVELSATAAIDVLDKGADVVVTMCDYNLGAPAAQEALAAGKLAYSCAGSALFGPVGIGPLAFSINESSTTQASIAASFAIEQGWKSAYMLGDTGEDFTKSWCEAFSTTFENLGGSVVGEDVFVNGDTTVQPQVSALVASGAQPDVVALCGYPPTGSTAVAQLRSAGVTAPIVTTSGFDGPGWLEAVPDVSDVYAVASASIYGDDPSDEMNDLVTAYTEEYGAPATSYLVYGYAIVQAIVAGMEEAGSTDGAEVAAALTSLSDIETILGATTYTEACHVAIGRSMQIIGYNGGTGAFVETVAPPADAIIPEGCEG